MNLDSNPSGSAIADPWLESSAENVIASCAHCDLRVPSGLVVTGDANQFCCNGCRTAFELIHSCGLDDFYRYAENKQTVVNSGDEDFKNYDTEYFIENFTQRLKPEGALAGDDPDSSQFSNPTRVVDFSLEGIHCSACVWLVEKLPKIIPGVLQAKVNLPTRSVKIAFESSASLCQIANSLSNLGYRPTPYQQENRSLEVRTENRKKLFQLGLAGAAAGNNMLVSLGIYLGQLQGMNSGITTLLLVYSGIISVVSLLGPGRTILQKAIWSVRTQTPHMDVPVALGITIAAISGWVNLILGTDVAYFDSISILIFVLLLGRYFQYLQQRSAIDQIGLLSRVTPQFSKQRIDGGTRDIATQQIRVGDQIEVNVKELIPVDGVVLQGQSNIDLSVLTGESVPQNVSANAAVYSGTTNLSEKLLIQATKTLNDSKVASIFRDVEESVNKKTRIVQIADRIGAKFVVVILVLAMLTLIYWLPNWKMASDSAVALLIVACPCALALATPLAISIALSGAIRRKILIKDGDAFEHLSRVETVWFDKTGTLTEGELRVDQWYGSKAYFPEIAAIEVGASHAISAAVLNYMRSNKLDSSDVDAKCVESFSNGIRGEVDGIAFLAGNLIFMQQRRIVVADEFLSQASEFVRTGCSPLFFARDGSVIAVAAVGDRLRPGAKELIHHLRTNGYSVGLLSGDAMEVVKKVARELAIDDDQAFGGLLPEEKSEIVKRTKHCLMVGDGINDSSAIANADVAVAINCKSSIGSKVSPIVIGAEQVCHVDDLLVASRRVMRVIYRNIAIALLYNSIAVTLAFFGLITPLWAAILMPVSSISVVASSLASNPFGNQISVQMKSVK